MSSGAKKTISSTQAGAGAAGIGGGTLVAAIANTLPDSNPAKPWLVLAAPAVSVGLSMLWLWARVELANYMQNRKLIALEKQLREALQRALDNPNTTERHRTLIRKKLEQVELLVVDHHIEHIQALVPVTANDVLALEESITKK